MANITQTIPSYTAGISQQPDEIKEPGQLNVATNVFPDITEGLTKRPGTRFIKQLDAAGAATDSQDQGKWFHYYRDETEQYLGQISRTGDVNMWKCSDGSPVDVVSSVDSSAMATYLTHTADQDIQTLTLNDYTYLTNRTKTTSMSSTTEAARPPEAFIELKKVAYASQYAVNLFDTTSPTNVSTATRLSAELINVGIDPMLPNVGTKIYNINGIPEVQEIDLSSLSGNGWYEISDGTTTIGQAFTNVTSTEPGGVYGAYKIAEGLRAHADYHKLKFTIGNAATKNDITDTRSYTDKLRLAFKEGGAQTTLATLKKYDVQGGTLATTFTATELVAGVNSSTNTKKNLYFRVTVTGQAVPHERTDQPTYFGRHQIVVDLLHGGEGWTQGQVIEVGFKECSVQVTIDNISTAKVQANLGLIRPIPTSFDAKSVVTAESIMGAIRTGILGNNNGFNDGGTNPLYQWKDDEGNDYHCKQIGNGLYISRPTAQGSFNISTPVGELLNVLTDSIKDIADLPNVCKHGYVVKVSNSEAEEDDYYVKFIGKKKEDGTYLDGEGVWEECAMPGTNIEFDAGTMPLVLIRSAGGTFLLTQLDGASNIVPGNEITSMPIGSLTQSTGVVNINNHGFTDNEEVYYFDGGSIGIKLNMSGQAPENDVDNGEKLYIDLIDANSFRLTDTSNGTGYTKFQNAGNNNQYLSNSATTVVAPQWDNAQVGDTSVDGTNPQPSFIGNTINKMMFFRNRFVLLSDENVIMSRPGDFYNFWAKSAIQFTAPDPIDISCSSEYPAIIYDGIQVNSGLILFTKNQQFMLTTDSDVLSPLTAKINFISAYNFNHYTNPFSLGTTVGFIDNVGQHSRLMEMARVLREGEPDVIEQSKVVSELLDKDLNIISASKENGFVALSEKDKTTLYCYKFFNTSDKRVHQAWFTWKFHWDIQYHFIIDDSLYLVLNTESSDEVANNGKCMLIKLDLKLHSDTLQTYTGTSTDKENIHPVYLDCATEVSIASNTYNASTNKTTFPLPTNWWTTEAAGGDMVLYETGGTDPVGRYAEVTINGSNVEVVGDWSSTTVVLGVLYEMEVEFPRIYTTRVQGDAVRSDTRGSLVLHRNKLNLGASGLYQTILKRKGKPTYTENHESVISDYSEESELPTLQLQTKVIPIYDRNINTTLTLKSKHPTPLTLYSMTWEGDYTNKFYSSV